MVGFGEALNGAVRESISSMLDVADRALSYGRALSYAADRYQEAANWLRRKIGDTPPSEDIPQLQPPYTGGQCSVNYDAEFRITSDQGNSPPSGFATAGVGIGPVSAGLSTVGTLTFLRVYSQTYPLGVDVRAISSSNTNIAFEISFTRTDGLPDDCGSVPIEDLPPEIPPEGYTGDITVIWDDRDTVTHTEEGDITIYAPVFSIDGSINIPINVNVGGIELDGSIDITNNLEVTLNPKGADRIAPRPTIDLPIPPDIPDGGDPVNLVLARNAISGVVVRSTVGSNAKATQVGQDGAPTLFLPRLANLYFVYRVGDSFAWSEPFPIVHINQLVPVPFDFSAYAYYIWEEYDVDCVVYPLSSNLVPLIPEP